MFSQNYLKLKYLADNFDKKVSVINQAIMIKDIMVYPEIADDSLGESPKRKKENIYKGSFPVTTRLVDQIKLLAYLTNEYHKQYNCYQNKGGTFSIKEDCLNNITRILLSEFALYTPDPLTMNEFSLLVKEIQNIASEQLPNVHLLLSTVPVVTEEGYKSITLLKKGETIPGYSRIVMLSESDKVPLERSPDTLYLKQENNLLCVYPFGETEPTILSPELSAEVYQTIINQGRSAPPETISSNDKTLPITADETDNEPMIRIREKELSEESIGIYKEMVSPNKDLIEDQLDIIPSTKKEPILFQQQMEISDINVVKDITSLCGYKHRSPDILYLQLDDKNRIVVHQFNQNPRILGININPTEDNENPPQQLADQLRNDLSKQGYGFEDKSKREIEEPELIKKFSDFCGCKPGLQQVLNTALYIQCGSEPKIEVFCKPLYALNDIEYQNTTRFVKNDIPKRMITFDENMRAVYVFSPNTREYYSSGTGAPLSINSVFKVKLPTTGAEYFQTFDICLAHKDMEAYLLSKESINIDVANNNTIIPYQGDQVVTSNTIDLENNAKIFDTIVQIDPSNNIAKLMSNDIVTDQDINNSEQMNNFRDKYPKIFLQKIEECDCIFLLKKPDKPPVNLLPNTLYLTAMKGCELDIKSIDTFKKLDTASLPKKPCLIIDQQGTVKLWGLNTNKWQLIGTNDTWELTEIDNTKIKPEWMKWKNVFLPYDEVDADLINALKKAHTFGKEDEYNRITIHSHDKPPNTLNKHISIDLDNLLSKEGFGFDDKKAKDIIKDEAMLKKVLPLCGREGFLIENPPFGANFRIVPTDLRALPVFSNKLLPTIVDRNKKLKNHYLQSQMTITPKGKELVAKTDYIITLLNNLYKSLMDASVPNFFEDMVKSKDYQQKMIASSLIKTSYEQFFEMHTEDMAQFIVSIYPLLGDLKNQLSLKACARNDLIKMIDDTITTIKKIEASEESIIQRPKQL